MQYSLPTATVLLLASLAGCASSRSVQEYWTLFYQLHASSLQQFAKQELDGLAPETYRKNVAICGMRGVVFWPYTDQPWIARVNPAAASGDFRSGDRVTAINGIRVNYLESLVLAISEHQNGEALRFTVFREDHFHTFEARCSDNRPMFEAAAALLRAASRGEWEECSKLASDLGARLEVSYSWLLELEHDCLEAIRLLSRRPPTDQDARRVYQWARLRIDEAKNIPGGVASARGSIQAGAAWLRRNHFGSFADDLMAHLDVYTLPYEYE